jgi:inner membrane protein
MFNSTHTFVALAIARTGAGKWAPRATVTAVIASNFPDIDSIAGLWGTAAYLDHHRGITHSLIGVPVFALLVSGVMYFFSEKFWPTYAIALISMATHPALDYLNSYGLRPLLPWSRKWFYGDAVDIIDPYLDFVLLIGILAGAWTPRIKRGAAWVSLVLAVLYIGARVELHAMALSKLNNQASQISGVQTSAALPRMLNPELWNGIIETNRTITQLPIYALRKQFPPGDRAIRLSRGPSGDVVAYAANAPSAAALLRFARFPITRVEQLSSEYRVTFFDFRFYRQGTALASEVTLDQSMHVVKDDLSFVQRIGP